MSVGALDSAGILRSTAEVLDKAISSDALLASMIGVASAVIDNVPLVVCIVCIYRKDNCISLFNILESISNFLNFICRRRLWECIRWLVHQRTLNCGN